MDNITKSTHECGSIEIVLKCSSSLSRHGTWRMVNIASQIPKSTPLEVDVKMHVYHTSGMTIGWHTQVYWSPTSTPTGGSKMFMVLRLSDIKMAQQMPIQFLRFCWGFHLSTARAVSIFHFLTARAVSFSLLFPFHRFPLVNHSS